MLSCAPLALYGLSVTDALTHFLPMDKKELLWSPQRAWRMGL